MQHEAHRAPVTALAFSDRVLLAGEGNYICGYDTADKRQLLKHLVFSTQAIHGIILSDETTTAGLVWGGSSCRRFHLHASCSDLHIRLGEVFHTDDWILDAVFSPSSTALVLVTAHNALWLNTSSTSDGSSPSANLELLVSGSNCILYSAHIKCLSPSCCLVAAGTAFGDIILWSAALDVSAGKCTAHSQVHYTFSAHAGSIFGVQISPWITLPSSSSPSMLLASCSDDRNVKLWDVSDLSTASPPLMQIQQDTGFGTKQDEHDGSSPPLLCKTMGHVSRVWHVRFRLSESGSSLNSILSFGEDAFTVTWDLSAASGSSQLPYAMSAVDTTTAHAGKNIWAVAVASNGTVATGGADGAITLHTKRPDLIPDVEVTRSLLQQSGEGDVLKSYAFVDPKVLLCTTDQGRVVLLDVLSPEEVTVTVVSEPLSGLRGYSIVECTKRYAFVAGQNGCVYSYVPESRRVSKILELGKKTVGLFASDFAQDVTALLVTSVGESSAHLLLLIDNDGAIILAPGDSIELALPKGTIVTSFAYNQIKDVRYAILGSRSGSIAIFAIHEGSSSGPIQPVSRNVCVHSKEAVTALRCVALNIENERFVILSTGRDGTLAMQHVSIASDSVELHLAHQLLFPFGPNVEAIYHPPAGGLWVWGFKSKHFIVYDVVGQREVMSVDCGGAHRNWAFQPTECGGTFVWTKASKVYRKTQPQLPYELVNSGGHGREIKSIAVSPAGSGRQFIATGAEDTNIKLFTVVKNGFRCLHTLRKHNTGIQHLQWSADGTCLFSSGGFEEFYVWKISSGLPYIDLGVVCESKHPRSGSSDLRIMGFNVQASHSGGFDVSMAYSDSTFKVWRYAGKVWQEMASADYLTACLTHVVPCHARPTAPASASMFTTASDGHIVRWESERELRWTTRHHVHQNAILATTSCILPDDSHLFITGGDDNAIGFSRFAGPHFRTLLIPRAHAAAVTGLASIPVGDGKFWLASASIDQRVKLWEVEVETAHGGIEGIKVKKIQDVFTAVADVSGLEVCQLAYGETGLLICGVGMDLWRLRSGYLRR